MTRRPAGWLLGLSMAALGVASAASAVVPRTNVTAQTIEALEAWDARIGSLQEAGALQVRQVREDTLLAGRQHVRLAQFHDGIPVFGGELVRQSKGLDPIAVFGTFYESITLDTKPAVGAEQVLKLLQQRNAQPVGSQGTPALVVLPRGNGRYSLAWKVKASTGDDLRLYFVDAKTGEIAHERSDLQSQAVGLGTGVLGDRKKVAARQQGGTSLADDPLRPPAVFTYDFKGDLAHLFAIRTVQDFAPGDLARDSDNTWTDGAVVDAHVYAGYTYDYYFKRFGRRGLDNNDHAIRSVVHPVRREDVFTPPVFLIYYLNAFYAGDGLMVYGEGLPQGVTAGGKSWNYFSGALDIVAHELTHGVTDYSSRLIYENESGALNEAFSDIMGTSVEFYFQEPGSASGKADYLMAEDTITPGGIRSMQNPAAYGDPDHYSLRYTGTDDNGGVHSNSGIPNHAFYLAVEGGKNRVSGLSVAGVGAAQREQIEKIFYRAFVFMLPPAADFAMARAATVQSARDLYGAGSAPERAVTEAWTAVGVN